MSSTDEMHVRVTPNMGYDEIVAERERLIAAALRRRMAGEKRTRGEKNATAVALGAILIYAGTIGIVGAMAVQVPQQDASTVQQIKG